MGDSQDVDNIISQDDEVIFTNKCFIVFIFQLLEQAFWWYMVVFMKYTNPDITHDTNNTHLHNGGIN